MFINGPIYKQLFQVYKLVQKNQATRKNSKHIANSKQD